MREGLVVCPKTNNAGASLAALADDVAIMLSDRFGGCTRREAFGHWRNDEGKLFSEPVWEFVVAYDPAPANDAGLRSIARTIGTRGEQEAVYVRYASGEVEILDTKPLLRAA